MLPYCLEEKNTTKKLKKKLLKSFGKRINEDYQEITSSNKTEVAFWHWREARKAEKISLLSMELMIDIVASALTFEHWASTQQQEQGHRLCRSQSTSSTHSTDSDTNTRIYRQNMPHLERPIVPHMRLIESLPNLSLYDAWCWFDNWNKWWLLFYYNDNNNQKLKRQSKQQQQNESCKQPTKKWLFRQNNSKINKTFTKQQWNQTSKKSNRPIDKLTNDDDDYFFFDEKNIFLNLKKKKKKRTTWTERPIYNLIKQHNWFCDPRNYFFEALKLENQILNLSISERKFGMIWNC